MTFTQLVDTKQKITSALLDIDMVRYFAKCSTADKASIGKILDYCDATTQALNEARACLASGCLESECIQNEVDNILKEAGYNNDNM